MALTKELAEAAAKRFIESGAANYTGDVFTITRDDGQREFEVVVTIQKAGAKSPQDRVDELKALLRIAAEALNNRHDYGLAAEDSHMTGVEHVSVTLEPSGGYPYFTIPLNQLQRVEG